MATMPIIMYNYPTNASGVPWPTWNNQYGTTAGSQTVYQYQTVTGATNVTTVNCQLIWGSWNQAYYGEAARVVEQQMTAEQLAAEERRQAYCRAAAALATEAHKKACERAEELLFACLTKPQREQYQRDGYVELFTDGQRRYQITKGRTGNVFELDQAGKRIARYCIHPYEDVPDQDTMLAQKLLLETSEAEFHRIANRISL